MPLIIKLLVFVDNCGVREWLVHEKLIIICEFVNFCVRIVVLRLLVGCVELLLNCEQVPWFNLGDLKLRRLCLLNFGACVRSFE